MIKKSLKFIYSVFPFKKQIFIVIRFLFRPGQNIYRHLHFKGKIKIKTDEGKSFKMNHYGYMLENDLFWAGINKGWEKVSLKYWMELCKDSKVIMDVGANTGIYSVIAKTIRPDAEIFAFEPVERNYEKLLENIKLNNFSIHTEMTALSNDNGKAVIYEDKTNDVIYSVTVNKSLIRQTEKVVTTTINIIRLDTFIEQHTIEHIDLMKIDVETHEPEVLEGFGIYLNKFQPVLLIEILNDEVAARIQELVKDIPYLFFNIDENSGIRQVKNLEKSDYYNYLFCKEETAKKLKLI